MTTHELAQVLLAGADLPVFVRINEEHQYYHKAPHPVLSTRQARSANNPELHTIAVIHLEN